MSNARHAGNAIGGYGVKHWPRIMGTSRDTSRCGAEAREIQSVEAAAAAGHGRLVVNAASVPAESEYLPMASRLVTFVPGPRRPHFPTIPLPSELTNHLHLTLTWQVSKLDPSTATVLFYI